MVARNRSGHFTIEKSEKGVKQWFKLKMVDEKQLKQKLEEEWSRREEELIERMATVVVDSETEGSTLPVRKRRNSNEIIHPSMSGGSPSEAGSSEWGHELADERSKKKKLSLDFTTREGHWAWRVLEWQTWRLGVYPPITGRNTVSQS
ncbi:hypothetical protein AAFF_G00433670 [Aldrovandia affinis]|uniref:Uncharacterized protein n=1 Tax=Aldrovandia affinis TaxID=143900 RepID=A0AAD7VYQ5_9TELE|nr:hypothetical protein AAFF_G00433670 [Aldrovandia affinis]